MTEIFIRVIILLYGLCVGSFLNVCIFRIPASSSLIKPRSTCPKCKNMIKYYDNIPVISYLLLFGKCRYCKTNISIRYPLTEILTGVAWLCTYLKFGLSPDFFIYILFISALIVITFIDLDHQIIPDVISLPGIPLCFLASFLIPEITWKEALLGLLAGGGSLWLVAEVYHLVTKKEGMGGGDIKLLAMIGALIGWQGVFFTIFTSSALGTLVGLATMLLTRSNLKLAIPFGPFLSAGAIIYIFFGKFIISWYFSFSGFNMPH